MRLIYVLVFALSLILTGAAILEWGAAELQKDWREVAFLTLIDAGWLIVATKLFSCLGLSLRDDAVDRKNTAALVALCGALLGVAFTYLGGNLGEGPSYWNNFYSAGAAAAALFALWVVLEGTGKSLRFRGGGARPDLRHQAGLLVDRNRISAGPCGRRGLAFH